RKITELPRMSELSLRGEEKDKPSLALEQLDRQVSVLQARLKDSQEATQAHQKQLAELRAQLASTTHSHSATIEDRDRQIAMLRAELASQRQPAAIHITLQSRQRGSHQLQLPANATVQQLIDQGRAAFGADWHQAFAWFGRPLQPSQPLAIYPIQDGDTVLFT